MPLEKLQQSRKITSVRKSGFSLTPRLLNKASAHSCEDPMVGLVRCLQSMTGDISEPWAQA
eukprot:2178547-Amphidinium_carterae.2